MTSLLQTSRRMKELEHALMITESTGLAQLPVHLVRLTALDDEQNAWFVIPRPTQQAEAFGEKFSVRLDFYKKDKRFFKCTGCRNYRWPDDRCSRHRRLSVIAYDVVEGDAAAVKVRIDEAFITGEPVEEKMSAGKGIAGTLASWYAWLFAPVVCS